MPLGACHGLYLWLGRWKVTSLALGHEAVATVSAVAERLVLGHSASAEGDNLPSGEPESGSFKVRDLKVPFDTNGTVS